MPSAACCSDFVHGDCIYVILLLINDIKVMVSFIDMSIRSL
jgi:hypothetical protein